MGIQSKTWTFRENSIGQAAVASRALQSSSASTLGNSFRRERGTFADGEPVS